MEDRCPLYMLTLCSAHSTFALVIHHDDVKGELTRCLAWSEDNTLIAMGGSDKLLR